MTPVMTNPPERAIIPLEPVASPPRPQPFRALPFHSLPHCPPGSAGDKQNFALPCSVSADEWERDNPKEECGVFGIYAPGEEVARITFFGLFALQHRGQESAGHRGFGRAQAGCPQGHGACHAGV